ncbi:MAG TPA: hypothetical protein VGM51_12020 [Armatimonadota bacterium]|jgi:hypothetical protein
MKRFIVALLLIAAACRGGPAPAAGAVGREFSVFNAPGSTVPANLAVGREFTVFNVPDSVIPANSAVGRELTVFNVPDSVIPANSAVGREITVFTAPESVMPVNMAVGREFTLLNQPLAQIMPNSAVGREFSAYVTTYTLVDVSQALRIAAGLSAGTPDSVLRLNVVITPPSATVVDVLDAARLAYLQMIAPSGQ